MTFNTPNSKQLELQSCRQIIQKIVPLIRQRRMDLYRQEKISFETFNKISRLETTLNSYTNQLAVATINAIVTDLEEPRNRIITVTNKVEAAIKELEDFNRFIKVLTTVVNFFGRIVTAASRGSIAVVATTLDELAKLTA
jgi:hypothetical protein